MKEKSVLRPPLVLGKKSYSQVTEDIYRQVRAKPTKAWYISFMLSLIALLAGGYALYKTWWEGVGMWGENKTVNWAWDITNFVWWIGIGHAGTLISAILLLFRQKWRNSINRIAEAMTLFAVTCSGLYIFAHLGRVWVSYWILPLPNTYGSLWINFNSALVWDMFAIATYLLVSLVYWYLGLIPDLATIRDKTTQKWIKIFYWYLSFGWNGSARKWVRYESVMLTLAGLATPLVVSVHSIVAMDFATGIVPGWHSTIFPPYFVAGAIFSGFAMVLTLMLVIREVFFLKDYITVHHIESMNKIIILNAGLVQVAYLTEYFMKWYSGVSFELYGLVDQMTGEYWWAYWTMIGCNVVAPQLLWFKKIRTNIMATWILSIVFNIGMWFERFVIVVASLSKGYLPSGWAVFHPTIYDIGVFVFSIGIFFTCFFLFVKFFPVVNIAEVKSLLRASDRKQEKTGSFSAENTQEAASSKTEMAIIIDKSGKIPGKKR